MSSKLALQFQTLPGWASAVVAGSDYVKVIDPPFAHPGWSARTIGRVYIADGETNGLIAQGAVGARQWWNRVAPTMTARPWVWAWELPNEPQPVANWDFCNALAAFTKEAARLLRAAGLRSVGGNLAEGNPGGLTEQERSNLFCKIAEGLTACDYWAQHCYWTPEGAPGPAGAHPEAGYTQWHARRDRLNAEYARARGIKLPPRFITECGIDGQIIGRPAAQAGWRAFGLPWDAYRRDHLQRLDDDLADEADVVAAFVFVAGGNADWWSFDLGETEARDLATYVASRRTATQPPAAPSTPTIPPPQVLIVAPYALARPLPAGQGVVTQWWGVNAPNYADIPGLREGHNGIDYGAAKGTPVLAAHDGTAYRGLDPTGFGQYIKVMGQGHYTIYGHLDAYGAKDGQAVKTGDVIGKVGSTGRSTGPHLHFGWKIVGVTNPGYLDYQNPLIGRAIYDALPQGQA